MSYSLSSHNQDKHLVGVLLINLGTPDSPEPTAVKRYLKEFLSDPRVVEKPRWLWWLILNIVILQSRPAKSAKAYSKVWTDQGSPILVISKKQASKLKSKLSETGIKLELAMRYGNPSIAAGISKLLESRISKLLVLPMYPQYCASTTATCFDEVSLQLRNLRWLPEIRFICDYHDRKGYILSLAASVKESWEEYGRGQRLVVSYHGIPKSFVDRGDPYLQHCTTTTQKLKQELNLSDQQIMMVFQSRMGAEEWLKPYCINTLQELPTQGITDIDIISPAFSADCLETLEELEMENRTAFMDAGGKRYQYIPALNDRDDHIEMLKQLVEDHTQGWIEPKTAKDDS